MNFISQVRALPNPAAGQSHPITLHLSPTSTASIIVTSLSPAAPVTQPFAKLAPDAEVIVAPKTRQAARPSSSRDSRSVTSRRSASGRSEKHRSTQDEEKARPPLFLRGLTRALKNEWLESEDGEQEGDGSFNDEGLKIWLDQEHVLGKTLRGVTWVSVSVVKPTGLQEAQDPQSQPTPDQLPASKVVAKLCTWEDAPDSQHVVLSSLLCDVLSATGLVGGIVRVDPAPAQLPKTASALKEPLQQTSKDAIVKRLRVTPHASVEKAVGFKFGGESKAEKEQAVQKITSLFGKTLLSGPLTDGMLLPATSEWPGGVIDFEPPPPGDPSKPRTNWLSGADRKLEITVQPESPPPKFPKSPGEPLSDEVPTMVAVETPLDKTRASLLNLSSVLLTGGLGSGKTSAAQLLAHDMRNQYLFNVTYIPCRSLVSEETRVKTIKDNLQRAFASAAWGARLGGRAVVILDDLDRLCPTETELQVDANGRSRQVSELLCSVVRQFCNSDTGVVLLATAQSKEALHNFIIGSHMVRDIIALKAPDKDGRRQVLDLLIKESNAAMNQDQRPYTSNGDTSHEWMEESHTPAEETPNGPVLEEDDDDDNGLDTLNLAGQTDGYMPGDLATLVKRTRGEALIRAVAEDCRAHCSRLRRRFERFYASVPARRNFAGVYYDLRRYRRLDTDAQDFA
jgi:peroxin-1